MISGPPVATLIISDDTLSVKSSAASASGFDDSPRRMASTSAAGEAPVLSKSEKSIDMEQG
ncbi:MAG: hypothetical protein H0X28_11090 [Solirubrobacterales bacterium]|nr:hypothetical protein [Solirubrobacterales bacterium]